MRLTFEASPAALTGFPSGPYVVANLVHLFGITDPGQNDQLIAGLLTLVENNPEGCAATVDGHRCFLWRAKTGKARITCIRGELATTGKPIDVSDDHFVALAPLPLVIARRNHGGQQIYAPGWPGKGVLEMSCVEGDLFITGEIGIEVKTSAE